MSGQVKTAVIPVAGNGSRIRPLSLITPKEMLATPFGPIIELVTNELIDAGIERIIYVTKPGKELIQNYLLNAQLHNNPNGKKASLEFVNQNDVPGNGGAILTAVYEKELRDPFIVVWGDEIFIQNNSIGRAAELINAFAEVKEPCIVLTEVKQEDVSKCGMARTQPHPSESSMFEITDLIEKPKEWNDTKNYASVGGYVITSELVTYLSKAQKSKDGEIYLSQAISDYLGNGKKLVGTLTKCEWHETGSIDGYIAAFEALAARRREGILNT